MKRLSPTQSAPHSGVSSFSPHRPHATDYKAMDRTKMPMRMPIVGYRGHLRNTKESTVCYGTSYWRPTISPTRAAAAAAAYEHAKQKAMDSFLPGTAPVYDSLYEA